MFGQIVAFFAVATSVAFATTCGPCYSGYGRYVNSPLPTGIYGSFRSRILNNGYAAPVVSEVVGAPVVSTGTCATPFVSSVATPVCATPYYRAVGCPEVISSCENSPAVDSGFISSGLYGSGLYNSRCGLGYGYGSTLGGCNTGVIATAC